MYYAIVNEENRVKKEFVYDTSDYTLLLDTQFLVDSQAWKWEQNIGEVSLESPPNYYEYLVTLESDHPVNVFEKHDIAAITAVEEYESEYYISTGVHLPASALPDNEMIGTGGATGWYTDMMASEFAGVGTLAVDPNPISFYMDESWTKSTFCHYDEDIFASYTAFGAELVPFFVTYPNGPWVFSLVNRGVCDLFCMRSYGAGLHLITSKYENDTHVRLKIYRKTIGSMTAKQVQT